MCVYMRTYVHVYTPALVTIQQPNEFGASFQTHLFDHDLCLFSKTKLRCVGKRNV